VMNRKIAAPKIMRTRIISIVILIL
jgi:hypothetical protein